MKNKLSFWFIFLGLIVGISYSSWIAGGLIKSQKIISFIKQANPNLFSAYDSYAKVGIISSWSD